MQKAITDKVKLENSVKQGFDALTDPNSAHLKILVEVPSYINGGLIIAANNLPGFDNL